MQYRAIHKNIADRENIGYGGPPVSTVSRHFQFRTSIVRPDNHDSFVIAIGQCIPVYPYDEAGCFAKSERSFGLSIRSDNFPKPFHLTIPSYTPVEVKISRVYDAHRKLRNTGIVTKFQHFSVSRDDGRDPLDQQMGLRLFTLKYHHGIAFPFVSLFFQVNRITS